MSARRTPHVRHRRKYAITPLPRQRWFVIRDPAGAVAGTASDLSEFSRALHDVDATVIAYHLERGDFSRWITGTIQDRPLGAVAGAIERDILAHRAADVLHAERVPTASAARYLGDALAQPRGLDGIRRPYCSAARAGSSAMRRAQARRFASKPAGSFPSMASMVASHAIAVAQSPAAAACSAQTSVRRTPERWRSSVVPRRGRRSAATSWASSSSGAAQRGHEGPHADSR
jgi:hypothetical protein